MNVILKNTTNKLYKKFINQQGVFTFEDFKIKFEIKKNIGFRTSTIKSTTFDGVQLKVKTQNSSYIFEKLSV